MKENTLQATPAIHPSSPVYAGFALIFNADGELLLRKNADRTSSTYGFLGLPGGRIEPEDTGLVSTIVRQVRQKTGLVVEPDARFLRIIEWVSPQGQQRCNVVATCRVVDDANMLPEADALRCYTGLTYYAASEISGTPMFPWKREVLRKVRSFQKRDRPPSVLNTSLIARGLPLDELEEAKARMGDAAAFRRMARHSRPPVPIDPPHLQSSGHTR